MGGHPQCLPKFDSITALSGDKLTWDAVAPTIRTDCAYLLECDATSGAVATFVEKLDIYSQQSDFDCFKLLIGYNLDFCGFDVTLYKNGSAINSSISNLLSLILLLLGESPKGTFHIVIKHNDRKGLTALQSAIYQQFCYLGFFIPVVCKDSQKKLATRLVKDALPGSTSYQICGAKKSGKSALVSALLGSQYCPISSELPTPIPLLFTGGKGISKKIVCGGVSKTKAAHFESRDSLCNYLEAKFREGIEGLQQLEPIKIQVPKYPASLKNACFIEVPASNFACSAGDIKVPKSWHCSKNKYIFIINYSSHLTDDEIKSLHTVYTTSQAESNDPLLVVVNRMDEMYSSDVVKSPLRFVDYIRHRLANLGYSNVLVLPTQALLSVYLDKIEPYLKHPDKFEDEISQLRKTHRISSLSTCISFLNGFAQNMQDFHGIHIGTVDKVRENTGIGLLELLIATQNATFFPTFELPQNISKAKILESGKTVVSEAQQKLQSTKAELAASGKKVLQSAHESWMGFHASIKNNVPSAWNKMASFVKKRYKP